MPKNLFWGVLPLLIILLALFIRWEDISYFLQKDNDNVLTCYDCYLYALLTQQRIEGKLTGINYLSNAPDYTVNTAGNQLITYLAYPFVKLFSLNVRDIYILFPPILGSLFVFPLMLWVRKFAGVYAFLGASLLGAFNFIYLIRTSPGRYDTDFLILFFLFLSLWLITITAQENLPSRAVTLSIISGLVMSLFMWWYPKPIFIFLFTFSLFVGSSLFGSSLKLTLVKTVLFLIGSGPINLIRGIENLWYYIDTRIFHAPAPFVPVNISKSVVELLPITLGDLVAFTSGNLIFLAISFLGLILVFLKHTRFMVIAMPFVALGISSFFAGNRMLIYLAPFLGLGAGFILEELARLLSNKVRKLKPLIYLSFGILVILMTLPHYAFSLSKKEMFRDSFYQEVKKLSEVIPAGSYIWTWWDLGYFLQYTLNRGTYIDNGNWNIIKMFAISHSFISDSEERARKLIAYTTNNLTLGLKYKEKSYKDFLADVEEYHLPPKNDVFVLISTTMFVKPLLREIGSYGSDLESKYEAIGSIVYYCNERKEVIDCTDFIFDKNANLLTSKFKIGNYYLYDRDTGELIRRKEIRKNVGHNLYLIKSKGKYYSVILESGAEKTNMSRWFFFKESSDKFKLIYDGFPILVLYRVE
ncbi:MAG: hypothetical protein GXO18_00305 [Aquificae bacterium]|nr:hypothetical protein [Aquificota bacterium]